MVFPTKAITIKSSQKIRFQYTVPEVQALAYKTKQYHNTRGDGISFVKPTQRKGVAAATTNIVKSYATKRDSPDAILLRKQS